MLTFIIWFNSNVFYVSAIFRSKNEGNFEKLWQNNTMIRQWEY